MLKPQYTRRPFNVLLIGPALSGKRTLAAQLLKSTDVFYKVFTAESIPKKPPARIDYVVITVDMTQSYSLALLDQALQSMQDRFLTNKTAIVVTKMDQRGRWQFEVERVQEAAASVFQVHVLYVNFLNELEKRRITDQLSRLIKTNTLQYRHVCTPLLNTVQVYSADDLLDDSLAPDDTSEQDDEHQGDIHEPNV
ncbi:hypothetical protein V8B55DRAFT_1530136 [Mucor lusitanicus]|uniref:Uncharacterized protein n=2 Tax=Mucor circinelloides f. lusitanicus TaxID=29924 RepID=A0A168J2J6_MUCCL|nr:hypothetical protein FB192DRAFT_1383840 [Mucor lusitanicus]OAD00663.1 hypothetical protein MUCCIDRAFT_85700 [Mucor lusitanicus CBS 277.49]